MADQPTLLAVFAHPDDESIAAGGVLARYAQEGVRTALFCATRGEWGPISDESPADYETLGSMRERELRAACDVLGVSWLRFLDLPDGGVSWAVEESTEPLERLVKAIRELRPQVVITFGPDGMYGHDDHIAVGRLTTEACSIAHRTDVFSHHFDEGLQPPRPATLYYAASPKGLMNRLVARLAQAGYPSDLWGIPPDQFGIDAREITTAVNVVSFVESKLAALRCHQTQLTRDHAFTAIPLEIAREFLGVEHFRLHADDPSFKTDMTFSERNTLLSSLF